VPWQAAEAHLAQERRHHTATRELSVDRERCRHELTTIYSAHDAAKLGDIAAMLDQYAGAEGQLLAAARSKYGIAPGSAPPAGEGPSPSSSEAQAQAAALSAALAREGQLEERLREYESKGRELTPRVRWADDVAAKAAELTLTLTLPLPLIGSRRRRPS
jgi:hypothetical protein